MLSMNVNKKQKKHNQNRYFHIRPFGLNNVSIRKLAQNRHMQLL